MRKILLILLTSLLLFAQENPKVVIDLTSGDLPTFEQKILKGIVAHKNYFESRLEELDVTVIIHGEAYKFFLIDPANSVYHNDKALLKASAELSKRIKSLSDTYDVTFAMCRSGMLKRKIDTKDIYDYVTQVPNAAIGLISKQNDGFAYLPVN